MIALSILLDISLSNTSDIASVLTKHTFMDTYYLGLLGTTTAIAEGLAVLFFVINFGWNYGKHILSRTPYVFDMREVFRTFTLMLTIPLFTSILAVIPYIVDVSKGAIRSTTSLESLGNYQKAMMNQYGEFNGLSNQERAAAINAKGNIYNADNIALDPNNANQQSAVNQNLSSEQTQLSDQAASGDDTDTGGSWMNMLNPMSWAQTAVTGLLYVLSVIIKILMESIIMMLLNIMLLLAPLAMAFSILPFMKEKLAEWFSTYINLAFCSFTLELIHSLVIHLFYGQGTTLATPLTSYASMIMSLCLICCYVSVFWLTSKFVGSDSAGRFISNGMQAVQTGAQMFMGGVAAGATAASALGSGGGAAAGAANAGKDALE